MTPFLENRGVALALPHEDTDMMQIHIGEIALLIANGAHVLLVLDRAEGHIASDLEWPKNIMPILPSSKSPELNPGENVWQFPRENFPSSRVFET